uniref:Uncharacterized protein n=1 Tax=Acrobeloides nanus TaxID=290746 RepID=A0A914C3X3_9BILA
MTSFLEKTYLEDLDDASREDLRALFELLADSDDLNLLRIIRKVGESEFREGFVAGCLISITMIALVLLLGWFFVKLARRGYGNGEGHANGALLPILAIIVQFLGFMRAVFVHN